MLRSACVPDAGALPGQQPGEHGLSRVGAGDQVGHLDAASGRPNAPGSPVSSSAPVNAWTGPSVAVPVGVRAVGTEPGDRAVDDAAG